MLFLYAWDPHFVKDVEALETVQNTVQKLATKFKLYRAVTCIKSHNTERETGLSETLFPL